MMFSQCSFVLADEITEVPGTSNGEVEITYDKTTTKDPVYSVTVDWTDTAMNYHVEGDEIWDPEDHSYSFADDVEKTWTDDVAEVGVTNHSNAGVTASIEADETNKLTYTYDKDSFDLATAEGTEYDSAPSDIFTITANDVPGTVENLTEKFVVKINTSGESGEEDPHGFSHLLLSFNPSGSQTETFMEKGYAQQGDVIEFGAAAYYQDGDTAVVNSENAEWSVSAVEGTLDEGTSISNGVLTISDTQEDRSVLEVKVDFTDRDGNEHSKTKEVVVSAEEVIISASIEEAAVYETGKSYQMTATAVNASGETVPMTWAFDANPTNEEDWETLSWDISEDGVFTPYAAGDYTISVWANYMTGNKVDVMISVEGETVDPDGGDEVTQYTVTLDGNGGTSDEITTTAEELWANLPDNGRDGYQFDGWYTELEGGVLVDESYVLESDTTFYAHWTPNTYYISYNANGGEGEMDGSDLRYDESFNLTENAYTKIGYAFNGWNTDPDGYGDMYADMASVKNLTENLNEEIVLYAQWKETAGLYDENGALVADWETLEKYYITMSGNTLIDIVNHEMIDGTLIIDDSVEGISDMSGGFGDCNNLRAVVVPESVNQVYMSSFNNCENLEAVYFEHTEPTIIFEENEMGSFMFNKTSGVVTTFYFKNSTVAESLVEGTHYTGDYAVKSTDYDW